MSQGEVDGGQRQERGREVHARLGAEIYTGARHTLMAHTDAREPHCLLNLSPRRRLAARSRRRVGQPEQEQA